MLIDGKIPNMALAALLCLSIGGAVAQEPDWQAGALESAILTHQQTLPDECSPIPSPAVAFHPLWIGEESASREALLVQFPCRAGAYNASSVYVLVDQYATASPVWFPSPVVEPPEPPRTAPVGADDLVISATVGSREVVNPQYDESSRTMMERNKWRGIDDAYTLTRWGFRHGLFEIMFFAVDASFDGADNPVVLIDRDIW